jgi:hypothetical protein
MLWLVVISCPIAALTPDNPILSKPAMMFPRKKALLPMNSKNLAREKAAKSAAGEIIKRGRKIEAACPDCEMGFESSGSIRSLF